ncbi:MAG: hypothetical protein COC03_04150 [Robiginitomaculum sp.]|nr:MAG: hypothetical protein COC03_04150 [Robiginitomaculum sp.]
MKLFPSKRKGSVNLRNLPDKSLDTLRRLSDEDLHEYIAGWREGTADYIAGMRELDRRTSTPISVRSWVAIVLSSVAILVSIVQLFID